MFSIDGLVSGLDTTSIIEGLVSLQASQVNRLSLRKNNILTQQTAFNGIEARLLSLRSTMGRLNRQTSSVFETKSGTSSDEAVLTVNADNKAAAGSYVVRVNSLARTHQIGSQGFDSDSTNISQGTISFQVGDRPATTVTIDQNNNTVDALVAAINTQSDDLSASIVHDQVNNADRILLTSNHTGASNQIIVTNNLAAGSGNVVRPDFTGDAIQEATNAAIQLGSGPGAITAEYETNSVENLIENVTLNLISADADRDITINITRDTEAAKTAIRDFVDEYNSLISFIDDSTRYNAETNAASPLVGNRNASNIKNRLGAFVTDTVPGLDSSLNRFSQLGIEIDDKGRLNVNSERLDKALNGELDGVDAGAIKRLFSLAGESTNPNIEFILGSTSTQSSATAYQVDILQVATHGAVTAANSLANSIVIGGGNRNREFQISIDGRQSEVLTLTAGTYTPQELADQIESLINSSDSLAGREVTVSLEGGALEITSASYGISSTVSGISGNATADLGFVGTESGVGQDVVGNFIVNGVLEPATGSGRVLIGDPNNENTADLQVRVTLDPSQVNGGIEGEIIITRGISSRLEQYFGDLLDPDTGTLQTVKEDFDLRIESLDKSIEKVNAISEAKTQYLIAQFAALERVLADLQTTSSFLTNQLASIGQ